MPVFKFSPGVISGAISPRVISSRTMLNNAYRNNRYDYTTFILVLRVNLEAMSKQSV